MNDWISVWIVLINRLPNFFKIYIVGFLREAIKRSFNQFVNEINDFALASLIAVITRPDRVSILKLGWRVGVESE